MPNPKLIRYQETVTGGAQDRHSDWLEVYGETEPIMNWRTALWVASSSPACHKPMARSGSFGGSTESGQRAYSMASSGSCRWVCYSSWEPVSQAGFWRLSMGRHLNRLLPLYLDSDPCDDQIVWMTWGAMHARYIRINEIIVCPWPLERRPRTRSHDESDGEYIRVGSHLVKIAGAVKAARAAAEHLAGRCQHRLTADPTFGRPTTPTCSTAPATPVVGPSLTVITAAVSPT
jgi:hypothetical protein